MASTSNGVNGVAVAVATFGGVLVYAGFRGVSPLQALRDVTSGSPPPVVGNPTDAPVPATAGSSGQSGFGDGKRGTVVAAAQKYVGDQYSQAKRTQAGYSDCSSFVDKVLKDAGIKPPFSAWANTANYRMSPEWKTIPASQAQPGDIAISSGHMVLVTGAGGTSAIGQQNSKTDVRTGVVGNLFSTPYVYKTWTGYAKTPGTGQGSGGGGGGSW
jgi:hypothetical protein